MSTRSPRSFTGTTNANANAAIPTDPTQSTTAIEKHTKKTAELIKDMKGGGTQTFQ